MELINEAINALLILIPLAAVPRFVYCMIKMNVEPEEAQIYKTRMKNLLVFLVIAECAVGLLQLVKNYF